MKSDVWIDHGITPPARLPEDTDAALAYLVAALGHAVYDRWTFTRLKQVYFSLAEAKRAKPAVFRQLIQTEAVIEFWERGRIQLAPESEAPNAHTVIQRLLQSHRRRFRPATDGVPVAIDKQGDAALLNALDEDGSGRTIAWLARYGRFINRHAETNTLAVTDDAQAVALFLRDRASRSRHTFRAYAIECRKLIAWCASRHIGPLSDLTRSDLLAYREALNRAGPDSAAPPPGERTRTRSLAVVASLFQYWYDTGYLCANPAAGLVTGKQPRAAFAPQRFIPPEALAACDVWVNETRAEDTGEDAIRACRRAIWALYRYAGVRLAELVWSLDQGLPRVEADSNERWTLYVNGKGQKPRAIPLPAICATTLRAYRQVRGLPSQPGPLEQLPLIHGFKRGSLQEAGLYREVKAIFEAMAVRLESANPATAQLLRAASPHWLRHAYAKALMVEHKVPLPVAQALLGHASVQTTAAYAKTDLSQLREFVEASFTASGK